jgi:hypothetical protein
MKLGTAGAGALLLLSLAACSRTTVATQTVGILSPGSTLHVRAINADVDAYKPVAGQPSDRYTIELSMQSGGTPPRPPVMRAARKQLSVTVADAAGVLVRVPSGVALDVSSARGRVSVTDVSGPVVANAPGGDVRIMVPGYAQASAGGNVTVYMGSTDWPGTLHFHAGRDVELWINATAHFRVHLHTGNGTIFTDFPLRGTAQGSAETIDGIIGNASHGIDVEVRSGSIRLLQLKPQM